MGVVWDKLFRQDGFDSPDGGAHSDPLTKQVVPPHSWGAASNPPDDPPQSNGSALDNSVAAIAATFDSIGQRNEELRNQLDSIAVAFRDVETVKTSFHSVLAPIDGLIQEIERTKTELYDATGKLSATSAALERLKGDHATVLEDRTLAIENHESLQAHTRLLEQWLQEAEASVSGSQLALAEKDLKIERLERDLENLSRRLSGDDEEMALQRAELAQKDLLLQEADRKRASLQDQHNIAVEESRSFRAKIGDLAADLSMINRRSGELEIRHADAARRAVELQAALAQESAAHGKLKIAHREAADVHHASQTSAQADVETARARAEAAERILIAARQELHEKQVSIRAVEQQLHQASATTQALYPAVVGLEKDLVAARTHIEDLESSRRKLLETSNAVLKNLRNKDVALQGAEQRVLGLEAKLAELSKASLEQREAMEARIATLSSQLEAERSARSFSEGALRSARGDRQTGRSDFVSQGPGFRPDNRDSIN
jgi:chromosome segregation ATPase